MRRRALLRRLGAGIATGPLFSRRASAQADGREEWAFPMGAGSSSPTVVDGTVYVGSGDGNLYAVDAGSGDEEWAFQTGAGASSPTVVDGTVYVGSQTRNLYAVDAGSGEEEWTFETGAPVDPSPTVADGTVYVGNRDGNLYAVDAGSGDEEWAFETEAETYSSATVVDGTVYVGSNDYNLYAVDAANGQQKWRFETGGEIVSAPTMVVERELQRYGTVYVGSGDGNLYAVDAASGNGNWTFETDAEIRSSPRVADGTVYVGSGDGNLYAVNEDVKPSKGSAGYLKNKKWEFDTGRYIASSLVVADGTVYVGNYDNNLYAVDAEVGVERWQFETRGPVLFSPTVVDETVYVGSGNTSSGTLYAVAVGPMQTPTPSPSPSPESPTRTPTPTPETTTDDGGAFWSSVTALPEEAVGGGVLAAVGGLAYGIFRRRGDGDTTDGSPSDPPGGGQEPASERAEPPESVGQKSGASPRSATEQSPGTRADFSREGSAPGLPETISSPSSRSLSYAEIDKGERVGTGGNADVYEAWLPNGDRIALKEPRMSGTVDISEIEQVIEKAEIWNKLDDHDHIVGVVNYDADPVPWLALEYMDAGDMSAVLATEPSFEARVWMAVSICRAVRHAHRQGVAHLDLKPANVLFQSAENNWPIPKVGDWGLAKMLLDHSKSIEGFSPTYSAPEQFASEEYGSADDITDIYQVGAVCYELFTGEPPFCGSYAEVMRSVLDEQPAAPSAVADVPSELDEVLLRALQKEKDDRYESIVQFRNQLQELPDRL